MSVNPPIAMLAELTHRCPLSCPYCSNPVELTRRDAELDTATWADVFRQAADLGVLQLHLSGGEPVSRRDLVDLVVAAREAGLYTNLITSGIGLTERRLKELDAAGLDHIQLSLQGTDAEMADRIGGYRGGFARKMDVARWIGEIGFPLTLNAVLHRQNLHQLPRAIEMAVEMGARRIEVATVQFHGWALQNRAALMPTRDQAREADAIVAKARQRLKGTLVIDYVPADYHSDYPKKCMGGWGSTGLNVAPDGLVLPCHAAQTIPTLDFDRVQEKPLREIWYEGAAFNAFRGTEWMQEPCRSCERKTVDFGGCRCQAMALVGDAAATDPVCIKSPHHGELQDRADAFAGGEAAFTARAAAG
ncbi:pyrroloquinoline quinone biosynthesis protein E [Rhodovulum sp. ES.010]|uniref:pyrroloquinoline quinone biosynthesis protein PqqE n=1 Tax=Rhodovulum sp. ES.010 TaxID=1882821 RepID=UPI0009274C1F|nr:pyrroloquinoline quinone biosynthesis protein PqqE [Rhodovulum sp. ES.010]SIO29096.1 pyrroloquinoline quinone biosynthesis protein E [Rhodovulum sp. ES.010]